MGLWIVCPKQHNQNWLVNIDFIIAQAQTNMSTALLVIACYIRQDNRRYYLDLKENSRGRFLRVSQTITRGGPRSQVALPAQGMIEFRDALTDLLDDFGTDDGGYVTHIHIFTNPYPSFHHLHIPSLSFQWFDTKFHLFQSVIQSYVGQWASYMYNTPDQFSSTHTKIKQNYLFREQISLSHISCRKILSVLWYLYCSILILG